MQQIQIGVILATFLVRKKSYNSYFKSQRKDLTSFCTQGGIHQASLLVNAGYSLVAHTLATLLHPPMSGPTLQRAGGWRAWEDAIGPVPKGLGQELIAGTRL